MLRIIVKTINGIFACMSFIWLMTSLRETESSETYFFIAFLAFILFFYTYRFMYWKRFSETEYIEALGELEEEKNGE